MRIYSALGLFALFFLSHASEIEVGKTAEPETAEVVPVPTDAAPAEPVPTDAAEPVEAKPKRQRRKQRKDQDSDSEEQSNDEESEESDL